MSPADDPAEANNAPDAVEPSGKSAASETAWPRLGYWIRVAIAVIAIVVALQLVLLLQGVLLVVFASLVLALGLQPAIGYLEQKGMGRGSALALIIVTANIALIVGAFLVIPTAIDQVNAIGASIPN